MSTSTSDPTDTSLEALADLFLTGDGAGVTPEPPGMPGRPRVHLRPNLQPPRPHQATPRPTASGEQAGTPDAHRAGDGATTAPASVATSSEAPTPKRGSGSAPALTTEAVLLGNLPGFANVWLTQYAHMVALRDGGALLLTLNQDHGDDGAIEAELVRPRLGDALFQEPQEPRGDAADPLDLTQPAPAAAEPDQPQPSDLAQSLERHRADTGAVLVYADPDFSGTPLRRLLSLGGITLLTGADTAAVHAAAGTVSDLHAAAEAAGLPQPTVGLVVVGVDADRAEAAAVEVGDLLHMERPGSPRPELLGHQQRITPVALRTIGTFQGLSRQWSLLHAALDTPPADAAEPASDATTDPVPISEAKADPHAASVAPAALETAEARPGVSAGSPSADEPDTSGNSGNSGNPESGQASAPGTALPPGPITEPSPDASHHAAPAARPPSGSEAQPLRSDTSDAPVFLHRACGVSTPDPVVAVGHSTGLDLVRTAVRCPAAPSVTFAQTAERLHLLIGHSATGPSIQTVHLELMAARDWATEHTDLLGLALPGLVADAPVTLHLLTDQAEQALRQVRQSGACVRLHLWLAFETRDGVAWYATPLG